MGVSISDIGPPTTIAAGATITEEYWFGDFFDVGVCYATIATVPTFLGWLDVLSQGRFGNIRFIGGVPHLELRNWSYSLTVANRAEGAIAYNLRIAILTGG